MATIRANDQRSFIYLGLAGETGRGRTVASGLYRLADGSDEWETLRNGLPDAPAVRALAVHPLNPDIVYAGTQSGPYRSADRGEHWEKVEIADHRLPVWSFLFHPSDPDVMFVGYENQTFIVLDNISLGTATQIRTAAPNAQAMVLALVKSYAG